ncbi:MAG: hypothetical protein AAF871_12345 [Pseudomonadota bacterium]
MRPELRITRGDVVVFQLDWPAKLEALTKPGEGGSPLEKTLGAGPFDIDGVDIFEASAVQPVGLGSYLVDGHGIEATDLLAFGAQLEGLTGVIVVVTARAFDGDTALLRPKPPLRYIAQFREAQGAPGPALPLESDAATEKVSRPGKKPKSDARIGGMVATAVLIFLALFVTFFVLSAG